MLVPVILAIGAFIVSSCYSAADDEKYKKVDFQPLADSKTNLPNLPVAVRGQEDPNYTYLQPIEIRVNGEPKELPFLACFDEERSAKGAVNRLNYSYAGSLPLNPGSNQINLTYRRLVGDEFGLVDFENHHQVKIDYDPDYIFPTGHLLYLYSSSRHSLAALLTAPLMPLGEIELPLTEEDSPLTGLTSAGQWFYLYNASQALAIDLALHQVTEEIDLTPYLPGQPATTVLAVTSDNASLFLSAGNTLYRYNRETSALEGIIIMPQEIKAIELAENLGRFFVTLEDSILVYDLVSNAVLGAYQPAGLSNNLPLSALFLSPDQQLGAVVLTDTDWQDNGQIEIIDPQNLEPRQRLAVGSSSAWRLAFSLDNRFLFFFAGSHPGSLSSLRAASPITGQLFWERFLSGEERTFSLTPTGRILLLNTRNHYNDCPTPEAAEIIDPVSGLTINQTWLGIDLADSDLYFQASVNGGANHD